MARLSRRLWGGTSLKTAAKEANLGPEVTSFLGFSMCYSNFILRLFLIAR